MTENRLASCLAVAVDGISSNKGPYYGLQRFSYLLSSDDEFLNSLSVSQRKALSLLVEWWRGHIQESLTAEVTPMYFQARAKADKPRRIFAKLRKRIAFSKTLNSELTKVYAMLVDASMYQESLHNLYCGEFELNSVSFATD